MSRITVTDLHSMATGLSAQTRYTLSFQLDGPGCLGLTGPSGSGKSLLLRAIADLDPSDGEVLLDGRDRNAFKAHEWRQLVGYLSADSAWWSDRVADHFEGQSPYGLELFGFDHDVMNWSISRLSSGERQVLSLSRLLSRSPAALLLDEPTSSLDATRTGQVEQLVADYAATHAAPVVWISHDRDQLDRIAQRKLELDGNGGIRQLT